MSSIADACVTYLALALSAAAAVMSAPPHASDAYQKLRWLLVTQSSPEALVTAGAIGETSNFPTSP